MRKQFYETKHKNENLDKVNNYINKTIDKGIKYDYLLNVFPILSKLEIDYDSKFFELNKITPNGLNFSSDEFKTMSYLAPFYKEKVKYNVKEIVRYLKFIGYDVDDEDVTLMCLDKEKPYSDNDDDYITFEEYLKLDDKNKFGVELFVKIRKNDIEKVDLKATFKNNDKFSNELIVDVGIGFADGFTIGWDTYKMK